MISTPTIIRLMGCAAALLALPAISGTTLFGEEIVDFTELPRGRIVSGVVSPITDPRVFYGVTAGDTPVLVCFTTSSCSSCVRIKPSLVEFARVNTSVLVAVVDAEEMPDISMRHHIRSVPTLAVWKRGRLLGIGAGRGGNALVQWVSERLGMTVDEQSDQRPQK